MKKKAILEAILEALGGVGGLGDRLKELSLSVQTLVAQLSNGPYLVGVTIRPRLQARLPRPGDAGDGGEVPFEPGEFFSGGQTALLKRGQACILSFDPQRPLESFEVEAWGGAVITDVKIGNKSLLFSYPSSITRGRFGAVDVGVRIGVFLEIPVPMKAM